MAHIVGQYERIESRAGGLFSSDTSFVRACHKLLADSAKRHEHRVARHEWIRGVLKQRDNLRQMHKNLNL